MINDDSERESQKKEIPEGQVQTGGLPWCSSRKRKTTSRSSLHLRQAASVHGGQTVKPQRPPSCPALYLMLQARTNVLPSSWISTLSSTMQTSSTELCKVSSNHVIHKCPACHTIWLHSWRPPLLWSQLTRPAWRSVAICPWACAQKVRFLLAGDFLQSLH